jgi:hypothetical protein
MAGLDPAIHVLPRFQEGVDARVKPAHDGVIVSLSLLSGAHHACPGRDAARQRCIAEPGPYQA